MRLSEAMQTNETVDLQSKTMRLSEALSEEKALYDKVYQAELRAITPEMEKRSEPITPEMGVLLEKRRNIKYITDFPIDYYSGTTTQIEAFVQGILPMRPVEFKRPRLEEAHPIATAVGDLVGLMATAYVTGGIAPQVTNSRIFAALPTVAKITAGRMAQTGVTFGLKELADNMAELMSGEKKDFQKVASDVFTSTTFGAGLGALGSIPKPILRIPAEASYGYATAKMAGATNFESGVNAAIFAVFGLFNTKNLSREYKAAAYGGAKQALADRMVAKGVNKDRAVEIAERYFRYALAKNGGYEKATIKDFDKFSQAMRKVSLRIEDALQKKQLEKGRMPIKQALENLQQKSTKSQLLSIYEQAKGEVSTTEIKKIANETPEKRPITLDDILPKEPPKFPGVKDSFLKQPKIKTSVVQYFKPAEYHLKELGFDAEIGQPIREALQDFSIELMQKNDFVVNTQKMQKVELEARNKKLKKQKKPVVTEKEVEEKIWTMMDKGIPKNNKSLEAKVARRYRKETEEMLKRMNEFNKRIGRDEIKGIKNYILHMLRPEVLNEIYSRGVIPPELAKVMPYIPPKNVFLRTAQQRQGVPEDWLVKNPHELMRAMYAIDLRYIYLQDALNKIDPYLKAVKDYVGTEGDYWSPETYKYLDDWIKQAIKMRPSNIDILVDNLLEYTLAPLLRKTGLKVSHMPWRDLVNTLSAAAHTGALGMRVRPILRNLIQSTFDWVMYGTKPYLKGSAKFGTKEGQNILNKSKVWKTRMPFEAQDLSMLQKWAKVGSLGYRASDLHNVGKGLLTRYYHAIDDLGKTPEQAIKWADSDLPATQWSYRREDLPRAYWTSTGRAFWTLGSWWMNYYTRFLPELSRRAFMGKDVNGRKVSTSERLGIMRLFILTGMLFAIKEVSKELTGTAIDYTGQVTPNFLRLGPVASLGRSFVKIGQGAVDDNDRMLSEGLRELGYTSKIFVPWYLAGEDLFKLLTGKKKLEEVLFYTEKKLKKVR